MAKGDSINNHPVKCYGCSICSYICPKSAINMKLDMKGFYYPYVIEKKCVGCRLCVSVCPIGREETFKNKMADSCFAIKNDDKTRLLSSSGGVYTAITDVILSRGGTA